MDKNKFLLWLYITVFASAAIIAAIVLLISFCHSADTPPTPDSEPPRWDECVTYIENKNGSVRLTDTVGFAFEFEVELYRDFGNLGFEIPLWGELENRLIIASTSLNSKFKPRIYVNGVESDQIPTAEGKYKIRLDISHITAQKYSAGNKMTVLGFGEIDLLSMY